jgi:formylglycine-generating enzyme required for sulfatase activity
MSTCLPERENINKKTNTTLNMVLVESGTFQMGSDEQDMFFAMPLHPVTISRDFFISRYEITNKQVADVYNWGLKSHQIKVNAEGVYNSIGNSQSLLQIYVKDCQVLYNKTIFTVTKQKENWPCIKISWYGAAVFCNLLSLMESNQEVYDTTNWTCNFTLAGYRLPTEAEWEYAASGGQKSHGYTFAGSNELDHVGWYAINGNKETLQVGLKEPNELGIYDMSGNVWEWCWDWHDPVYYFDSPESDPLGPASGNNKVIRGGAWYLGEMDARIKSRLLSCDPAGMGNLGGFRVVKLAK